MGIEEFPILDYGIIAGIAIFLLVQATLVGKQLVERNLLPLNLIDKVLTYQDKEIELLKEQNELLKEQNTILKKLVSLWRGQAE